MIFDICWNWASALERCGTVDKATVGPGGSRSKNDNETTINAQYDSVAAAAVGIETSRVARGILCVAWLIICWLAPVHRNAKTANVVRLLIYKLFDMVLRIRRLNLHNFFSLGGTGLVDSFGDRVRWDWARSLCIMIYQQTVRMQNPKFWSFLWNITACCLPPTSEHLVTDFTTGGDRCGWFARR